METNSKDFGAVKNTITGKTIREMTREELFALAGKPMTTAEAMRQMQKLRIAQNTNPPA